MWKRQDGLSKGFSLYPVSLPTNHKAMFEGSKATFSGHNSFQCRPLWLKKGFDFVKAGKSFASENAVVDLGVGKNMVGAIRYWLRAFDLLEENELTQLSELLFDDDMGYDPYLEDEATLWLLHYHLVKKGFATSYLLIFNELRKEKVEFSEDYFLNFIERKSNSKLPFSFNSNTVKSDFEVFQKLYVGLETPKDREEIISGILTELRLVNVLDRPGKKRFLQIEETERSELPIEILLYAILDNRNYGMSINFESLVSGYNSPGSIFAINRTGLLQKIEVLVRNFDFIIFKDDAGIRELQFKEKPKTPFEIFNNYYHVN